MRSKTGALDPGPHSPTAQDQLLSLHGLALFRLTNDGLLRAVAPAVASLTGRAVPDGTPITDLIAEPDATALAVFCEGARTEARQVVVTLKPAPQAEGTRTRLLLSVVGDEEEWLCALAPRPGRPTREREETSLERELQFNSMADAAPVLMWRTDENKQADYFNRTWLEFTGRTTAEEQGEGWLESVHPDDRDAVRFMFHSANEEGSSFRMEYRLRHHDESYRWILHQGTPHYRVDGTFAGYVGSGFDITENVNAETALINSERRNRALLNALPDAMLVINREGVVTEFNASADAPSATDPTGLSLTDPASGFPPAVADVALQQMAQAHETRAMQSFEYHVEQDGEAHYYEARMVELNRDEVLGLFRDITPLKRTQQELNATIADLTVLRQIDSELSENLDIEHVVGMALDAAFRVTNANAGFIALAEDGRLRLASSLGEYVNGTLSALLGQEDSLWARVFAEQHPRLIHNVQAEPAYQPLLSDTESLIIYPLMSRERAVGLMGLETRKRDRFHEDNFAFLRLITGRIASTLDNANLYRQTMAQLQELQRLYAEVSKLEQLKTDMIRIASHDLRNPLAAIMGYLEMLRWDLDKNVDPSQQMYLQQIEESARKMQRITMGILSLERIEQMAQSNQQERFDLGELIRRCFSENRAQAEKKKQVYEMHIPEERAMISGDQIQIHEAVSNLITNAIKYTPEEGTVTVELAITDGQGNFRVIDTGYGVPQEQQKRLFQPFFRARMQETQSIEGTGLGLHLVKNIVERHKGRMIFTSERGKGSTFGFEVPLAAPAEASASISSSRPSAKRND